ncbi:Glycerol-3-phosphate dehydrogenase [NAD(P)+] 1 [Candidatus Hydrogenisulfobacillus filiaventi]|uniref:Glycerol-3-phosphate dehydrogenase [NAD(P)+] n=1 Tax=Candidatus Hydrogenisulfobacillus filiaventi TaxID=2707344 RepID=A0A6F8ZG16_9FIRM|nr:NAD(P)-dependent glycerol-3-phosphate dehydrogenase [Bacillota bacterium]CAB1128720.1 Glycerol-3-phosphate dehydrogenase [NAD(P)+] 1 [Candidatus Hydrogenisulfobacillus filiaventi]
MSGPAKAVTVFGGGSWGLTLAALAARSGAEAVTLWVRREAVADHLRRTRRHPDFLPQLRLPAMVEVTTDLGVAADRAPLWLLAVPSQYLRGVAVRLGPPPPGVSAVSAAKGLEQPRGLRMTEVLHELWGPVAVGALSGPNLAVEVAAGKPAATVLALEDPGAFGPWSQVLGGANLRVYLQTDVVGVELGGALKNILALAAGMADAQDLGASAKAALITRGLHEMGRLAVSLGARVDTLAGLAGLGDVVVTAFSVHSRNHWCGFELGRGRRLTEVLASTNMVVEGVETARVAQRMGHERGLSLPITDEVVAILDGKPVQRALRDLMARTLVPERD